MSAMTSNKTGVQPAWLTFAQGSCYTGLCVRTLENYAAKGHIVVANIRIGGEASRGRRLIDRESLDRFIRGFIGAPVARLKMNQGRKGGVNS